LRRVAAVTFLALLFVIVILPAVIVKSCRYPDTSEAGQSGSASLIVRVWVHTTATVVSLPLEDYVTGVVAAEMPTSFDLEALKAQAVLARTFAIRHLRAAGGPGVVGRPGADVTTDIWADGQAWLSEADAHRQWGVFAFYGRWQKVREAVQGTAGLVLASQGVPIEVAYHSTCGGATENSEDVWTEAVPYLRGVADPWCAGSPWATKETDVSPDLLERVFGLEAGTLAAGGDQRRPYVQITEETTSGRAMRIRVGEKEVTSSEFRKALGLPSARFTYTTAEGVLHIVTQGYGHGVGLCQYGADGLARSGKDYREILAFYFAGTEVVLYSPGF
jgi:stage II sporulation protein D